jgi:RNA polymerase sigma-70 factor (ECF subfamily)
VEGRPELPDKSANALDIVAAKQTKDKVREILLELEPRDRSLLKAVFLDERDRDEVCREFGVDRDYLRVLLHRAKQEFKTVYIKRIGSQMALGANA